LKAPLVYNFYILRPWYQQWWFYTLLVILLAAVLFGLYKYRVNQLLKLERLRRKIASDLHDDIGSTVSSINIYTQLIKNGQRTEAYVDAIQANTAEVISSLDELVWNVNPKFDSLEQLVDKMKLFALPLLSDNNIACRFDATIENGKKLLTPEWRTHIYLIFKEAVNNAIKHAQCTECNIRIAQAGKWLTLSIHDNGKGFDIPAAMPRRNGITNMQQRAANLKGNLRISSQPGNGTHITLTCNITRLFKIT